MNDVFLVKTQGATVAIPSRIHTTPPPDFFLSLLPQQLRDPLLCKYTRHHNGHVRERFLKKILNLNSPLVAPYIVQLSGEYVIELLDAIYKGIESYDCTALQAFLSENQQYCDKTRQRMISYWDCYYRAKYPRLRDYVGYKLFEKFDRIQRGLVASPDNSMLNGLP